MKSLWILRPLQKENNIFLFKNFELHCIKLVLYCSSLLRTQSESAISHTWHIHTKSWLRTILFKPLRHALFFYFSGKATAPNTTLHTAKNKQQSERFTAELGREESRSSATSDFIKWLPTRKRNSMWAELGKSKWPPFCLSTPTTTLPIHSISKAHTYYSLYSLWR